MARYASNLSICMVFVVLTLSYGLLLSSYSPHHLFKSVQTNRFKRLSTAALTASLTASLTDALTEQSDDIKDLSTPKLSTVELIEKLFLINDESVMNSSIKHLRQLSLSNSNQFILPSSKSEAWRYNNLFNLFHVPYSNVKQVDQFIDIKGEISSLVCGKCSQSYYVFVDGIYVSSLSHPQMYESNSKDVPVFIRLRDMQSSDEYNFDVLKELGFMADLNEPPRHTFGSDTLTAFNLANIQDGGVMYIPRAFNASDQPVQFIHVSTGRKSTMAHPKLLIYVDDEATFNFKQSFLTLDPSRSNSLENDVLEGSDPAYLVNSNTRVVVGRNANVHHTYVQELSGEHNRT